MKYIAIHSEGGLIPYDLLEKIANEDAPGQKAADFGLAKGRRLSDEIQRVWSDAQELWSRFKDVSEKLSQKDPYGTTLTRDRWIGPLLTDPVRLSYDLRLQTTGVVLDGLNFPISHWAGEGDGAPPVHIEGFKVELDRKGAKLRTSPRAMVQEFLNHSEAHLWGIVTNGLSFRLLRDSARTARPTYLEFDLESILEGNRFSEFAIFYRLCHRSRLPKPGQEPTECLLEQYHQLSIEQGGRVRDKLRDGVEDALKALGNGFLQHPANEALRQKFAAGHLPAAEYHRQLLRLVYRLLFLMVAEERRMIVSQGENAERHQRIYRDYYSVSRLRERAEAIVEKTAFSDLWLGLKQTFLLFSDNRDSNPLGIPPLNGDLFSDQAAADLNDTQLYNHELLLAIRRLSMFDDRGVQQRVNYSALDVEELGSVYESLLDYRPVIEKQESGLAFDLPVGSERKTTGSYYTRPELVRELIQSALMPVMEDRLKEAGKLPIGTHPDDKKAALEKAILGITVCDPACGSGHFLLEAARRLGRELARIRTGEDEPSLEQFHLGVRDAVSHCIYGVDLNPLAVDLCKLALWLEGHWTGKPLSFLDHRIKCGNSLLGVFDPEVLKQGIPDEAFNYVTGDDKKAASAIKKLNKKERQDWERGQRGLPFGKTVLDKLEGYAEQLYQLSEIAENNPADVKRKADLYRRVYESPESHRTHRVANLWTAAFFMPLTSPDDPTVPSHERFMEFLERGVGHGQMIGKADGLAEKHRFFHWFFEFPEVFARGGFDVVLGNPPWERPEFHEEEHWRDDPYIAGAANKAERLRRIDGYRESSESLKNARVILFDIARHDSEAASKFLSESTRFPLTAVGKFNVYALFSEVFYMLLNGAGGAGVLVPTGIATDDTTKRFFDKLMSKRNLAQLIGFENESLIFPAVHHSYRFCALTITGKEREITEPDFVFFCRQFGDIRQGQRHFKLSREEVELLNPNTRTCPVFRTSVDAEITKKVYARVPPLVSDVSGQNSWQVEFRRIFNMGMREVIALARSHDALAADGYEFDGMLRGHKAEAWFLPVMEAKMIYHFDHRYATYAGASQANINEGNLPKVSEEQKRDSCLTICPRHWLPQLEVKDKLKRWRRTWLFCFRDVTSAIVERTCISAIIPNTATDFTLRILFCERTSELISCLLANFNALPFDYIVRQKIAGTHLSDYITRQLPVLSHNTYTSLDICFVAPRVLELVYTCWDIQAFADDVWRDSDETLRQLIRTQWEENKAAMGSHEFNPPEEADIPEDGIPLPPFKWDEDRRAQIRAELDAYYALLYGLTRDELRYILDPKDVYGPDFPGETFRVLKEKEEKRFGEYRTRRLVLEAFDKLAESPRFRDDMHKRTSTIGTRGFGT